MHLMGDYINDESTIKRLGSYLASAGAMGRGAGRPSQGSGIHNYTANQTKSNKLRKQTEITTTKGGTCPRRESSQHWAYNGKDRF